MSHFNHIDLVEFPAESVEQLQAAKEFFGQVFGWKFQDWGDHYADTADSGVSSGLIANAGARSRMPLAVVHVDDLEAAYEKVTGAGGTIVKEIFSFPGGRRFHFRDPAGNELAAWSE
ncbi:VOC family protein [Streptosporangium sp. NPDC048047]|uniref:VOC family protein n=1 Tax=Streptosporangium sp. NPDC048047 TaxID=3155748 RepID=UPI003430E236